MTITPCPYCGSSMELETVISIGGSGFVLECTNFDCPSIRVYETKEECITAFNNRITFSMDDIIENVQMAIGDFCGPDRHAFTRAMMLIFGKFEADLELRKHVHQNP